MWDPAPTGKVCGITTMLVMPAKLEPLMDGPWHSAQPLTMPVWSIVAPEKLVKPVMVEAL
jgi:hypothetical protein